MQDDNDYSPRLLLALESLDMPDPQPYGEIDSDDEEVDVDDDPGEE